MKLNQLTLVLLTLVFFISCKKDCDETYSITGRFYDRTGDTPYTNAIVHLDHVEENGYGHNDSKRRIELLHTDKNGEFQVNYKCLPNADYIEALYHTKAGHLIIKRLPVNQNYHEELIIPSMGTVRLYLHSDSAVGINNNDTLFLAFHNPIEDDYYHYDIDTILHFENGLYKTYRMKKTTPFRMYYGRGSENFNYQTSYKHFYNKKEYINQNITGDPNVDEITIEY